MFGSREGHLDLVTTVFVHIRQASPAIRFSAASTLDLECHNKKLFQRIFSVIDQEGRGRRRKRGGTLIYLSYSKV